MLWFLAGYSGIRAASGAAPSTKASVAIHMEIRAFYTSPRHGAMGTAHGKGGPGKHSLPSSRWAKTTWSRKFLGNFITNKGLGPGCFPVGAHGHTFDHIVRPRQPKAPSSPPDLPFFSTVLERWTQRLTSSPQIHKPIDRGLHLLIIKKSSLKPQLRGFQANCNTQIHLNPFSEDLENRTSPARLGF